MKAVKGFLRTGEAGGIKVADLLKPPPKKGRAKTQQRVIVKQGTIVMENATVKEN